MSMREYGVLGYGFEAASVPWDYKKIIKKLGENAKDYFEPDFDEHENAFEGIDQRAAFFEEIFFDYNWLDFEWATDTQYILMYEGMPWHFQADCPKTEEETTLKMFKTIKPYISDSFSFDDFKSVVGFIDDTYFG